MTLDERHVRNGLGDGADLAPGVILLALAIVALVKYISSERKAGGGEKRVGFVFMTRRCPRNPLAELHPSGDLNRRQAFAGAGVRRTAGSSF